MTNTNAAAYNPLPVFTVVPSYCKYSYVWTVTNLQTVNAGAPVTAIQQSGDQFNFLYMFELPDMSQKQTATVTATTYSDYSSQNAGKTASASFDLTFLDACLYDNLITLTPVAQTQQITGNYNAQPVIFTYSPFGVSPAWCDASVTCDSVVGPSQYLSCQQLDSNGQIVWTFDNTDYTSGLTPGSYTYTFNV